MNFVMVGHFEVLTAALNSRSLATLGMTQVRRIDLN